MRALLTLHVTIKDKESWLPDPSTGLYHSPPNSSWVHLIINHLLRILNDVLYCWLSSVMQFSIILLFFDRLNREIASYRIFITIKKKTKHTNLVLDQRIIHVWSYFDNMFSITVPHHSYILKASPIHAQIMLNKGIPGLPWVVDISAPTISLIVSFKLLFLIFMEMFRDFWSLINRKLLWSIHNWVG